jgi:hypothetical protein
MVDCFRFELKIAREADFDYRLAMENSFEIRFPGIEFI